MKIIRHILRRLYGTIDEAPEQYIFKYLLAQNKELRPVIDIGCMPPISYWKHALKYNQKIICVDANPDFDSKDYHRDRQKLLKLVLRGRIKFIEKALYSHPGKIDLYVKGANTTINPSYRSGVTDYVVKNIECDTYANIIDEIPYMVKIDCDGADTMITKTIVECNKPDCLMIELAYQYDQKEITRLQDMYDYSLFISRDHERYDVLGNWQEQWTVNGDGTLILTNERIPSELRKEIYQKLFLI